MLEEESSNGAQPESTRPLRRRAPRPKISPRYVHRFVEQLVGDDLDAKRVLSLANGVLGVMHAAALAIHFIGEGLAGADGTDPKHAIKQVDRLLSNPAISVWAFFARWVPYVVGPRKALRVALDWTEFDRDGQTTIAMYLNYTRGRPTARVAKEPAGDNKACAPELSRCDADPASDTRLRPAAPSRTAYAARRRGPVRAGCRR
jgi:hypothetical protein